MADKNKTGDFYTRPESDGAKNFLWNSETKQFMGRTSGSWGRILLFYVIFYAVLAAFFAILFSLFNLTIKTDQPKYLLGESLIGENPGLGFRPMPVDSNVESTLIWLRTDKPSGWKVWTEELDKFLEPFNKPNEDEVECIGDTFVKQPNKVCKVDVNHGFKSCTPENNFGFSEGKPCIFLKLNKIFNWEPQYYTYNNMTNWNKDNFNMPESLIQHIKEVKDTKGKFVWVSCEGEYPADTENIGKIEFYSMSGVQGFSGHYFPFSNQEGYKQPLVAVKFMNPTKGVLINVECKAWAQNIKHDRADRRGSVHFELMVDKY